MQRRNILKATKAKKSEPLEVKIDPDLEEDQVFKKPEAKQEIEEPEEEVVPEPEPPKKQPAAKKQRSYVSEESRARMLEASARGRETARLNRTKKAQEKAAERQRILESYGGEKGLREYRKYEKLRTKFESDNAPPAVKEKLSAPPPRREVASASAEPEPTPPPPPVQSERTEPYKHVGSSNNPGAAQHVVDYDRIINGLAERMQRQYLTDKEVQEKMRQQAFQDARSEVDLYKDKYTNLQRKQTVNMLTNNRVFQRTQSIKDQYRGRSSRGWYRR